MTEFLGIALSLADKVMGQMPSYEQKKKEKFYKIRKRYENEMAKDYDTRDDALVDYYRNELRLFLEVFIEEISGQSV